MGAPTAGKKRGNAVCTQPHTKRQQDDEDKRSDEALDLLLAQQGERLAAIGWAGYVRAGSGFVLTDGEYVGYCPASLVGQSFPLIRRRLRHLVKRYQPAVEVVVVFTVPWEEEKVMLAVGMFRPPLAPEAAFLKQMGTPGCPPLYIYEMPEQREQPE